MQRKRQEVTVSLLKNINFFEKMLQEKFHPNGGAKTSTEGSAHVPVVAAHWPVELVKLAVLACNLLLSNPLL